MLVDIICREKHNHEMYTLGFQPPLKQWVVNITTIVYLRVLIIQIGSTIILMVVEAQGVYFSICKMDVGVDPIRHFYSMNLG